MYLNEAEDQQLKDDLALCIEEVLLQRIQGVKNERGDWITPAFPKLIYVLEEDNIHEDSKYYYLTKLAADCTIKRLVPDYISEKIMKQLKNGDVYAPMGCIDAQSMIHYKIDNEVYLTSIEKMWNDLSTVFETVLQPGRLSDHMIKLKDVRVFDSGSKGFVNCPLIVRNFSHNWVKIILENGIQMDVTYDHIFTLTNGIDKEAKDLNTDDELYVTNYYSRQIPIKIKSIEKYKDAKFSYDVTTESEHFDFNNVWSHNCRAFLTPDRFTKKLGENISHALNFIPDKTKYYGRLRIYA